MAAEIGHMRVGAGRPQCGCGRQGCLEQYASGIGPGPVRPRPGRDDPAAPLGCSTWPAARSRRSTGRWSPGPHARAIPRRRAAFAEIGHWLGSGLADLVQLLDVEMLVVGGGVIDAGELLLAPARATFVDQFAARGSLPRRPDRGGRDGQHGGRGGGRGPGPALTDA